MESRASERSGDGAVGTVFSGVPRFVLETPSCETSTVPVLKFR